MVMPASCLATKNDGWERKLLSFHTCGQSHIYLIDQNSTVMHLFLPWGLTTPCPNQARNWLLFSIVQGVWCRAAP